jgi:hypothetical protein
MVYVQVPLDFVGVQIYVALNILLFYLWLLVIGIVIRKESLCNFSLNMDEFLLFSLSLDESVFLNIPNGVAFRLS